MSATTTDRLEAARAAARAELKSRPSFRPWWHGAAALALLELGIGIALGYGVSSRIGNGVARPVFWALAGALATVLTAGAVLGLAPGPKRKSRGAWAAMSALILLGLVVGGSGLSRGTSVVGGALLCGGLELAVSGLPFAVALWMLTRFAATPLRTAQVAGSAAAAGLLMLHIHCPDGSPAHLLLGHVLPALVVIGLALWLRKRLPTRSYAP